MHAFAALLDTLIATPEARKPGVEQMILDTFQRRKAVLALDMSGFTLTVRRDGILAYLCQIRRMHKITRPLVLAHHGEVVKNEADNLLAVFDDVADAVAAALAMVNAAVVEGQAPLLAFSVGIDVGEILLLEQVDCFGDAVNLAYKLGEDIARPGEVLVTQRVREQLTDTAGLGFQSIQVSISGMDVTTFAVTPAP
ncbi:adenylate/guanylate cyclase domain-containing protein [Rhodoferax saidenbachensis]|uniref:Class 3 adenylate cyclase n=1 Tax=Rhodoferax saidenbachensis TaxID=1484693 RepID=A0ABU1ZIE4_9BURK|nr:adenylate/guanylate cyclase domain-containing protein [Rhodoferax saidenbachensis]MDR7305314.1 class 3 adenylate cyclase [Rhodoferax saidenbachensis]